MAAVTLQLEHALVGFDTKSSETGTDFHWAFYFGTRTTAGGTVTQRVRSEGYQSNLSAFNATAALASFTPPSTTYAAVRLTAWSEYGVGEGSEGDTGYVNSNASPYSTWTAVAAGTLTCASGGGYLGEAFQANRSVTGLNVTEGTGGGSGVPKHSDNYRRRRVA